MKLLKKIVTFYIDGFKSMTVGKRLWIIIIIKLFIMFVILKVFFFRDFLSSKHHTDADKGNYVLEQLTK